MTVRKWAIELISDDRSQRSYRTYEMERQREEVLLTFLRPMRYLTRPLGSS